MSDTMYTVNSSPSNEVLSSLWQAVQAVGGGFSVFLKFAVLVSWQLAELEKLDSHSGWHAGVELDDNCYCLRTEVSLQGQEKQIIYPDWFQKLFTENSILMLVEEKCWELTVKFPLDEIPTKERTLLKPALRWEGLHTALLEHLDQQLNMEQEIKALRNELLLTNQGIVALVEVMEGHYEKGSLGETQELQFDDRVRENRLLIDRIREKELALKQADRLASIGQLVAGVAHEINNPLTFMRMNLELMTRYHDLLGYNQHPESSDMYIDLRRAMKASLSGVERISKIVEGLKFFSRQQAVERKAVNLADVIHSAWMLVSSDRTATSRISLDCQEVSKTTVSGSYQQLEQVMVNFLQNATRAINKAKVSMGRIKISVRPDENKQGWVIVEVSDNGCGIDSKDIAHIFEPFYSQDPEGMGLGLSIVHGIVKEHGGYIAVVSELGKGTSITLRLPKNIAETK